MIDFISQYFNIYPTPQKNKGNRAGLFVDSSASIFRNDEWIYIYIRNVKFNLSFLYIYLWWGIFTRSEISQQKFRRCFCASRQNTWRHEILNTSISFREEDSGKKRINCRQEKSFQYLKKQTKCRQISIFPSGRTEMISKRDVLFVQKKRYSFYRQLNLRMSKD